MGKNIPDEVLRALAASVSDSSTFDAELFEAEVERIEVPRPNEVIFCMRDGQAIHRNWADRSRSESWDTAARERARQHLLKRWAK